jgi:hypothetical protein
MLFTVCGAFTTIGADEDSSFTLDSATVESEIIEEGLVGVAAANVAIGGAAAKVAIDGAKVGLPATLVR